MVAGGKIFISEKVWRNNLIAYFNDYLIRFNKGWYMLIYVTIALNNLPNGEMKWLQNWFMLFQL